MLWGRWSADANPSFLNVVKGRGAIGATNTIVSGDTIFRMDMYAEDGTTTPILSSRLDFDTEGTIANSQAPGVIVASTANSSGTITEALRIDSAQKIYNRVDNTGFHTGAGDDLAMSSDGDNAQLFAPNGNMVIRGATGMYLQSTTGENLISAVPDGATTLFHNNVAKLATTAAGVDVTGDDRHRRVDHRHSGRLKPPCLGCCCCHVRRQHHRCIPEYQRRNGRYLKSRNRRRDGRIFRP